MARKHRRTSMRERRDEGWSPAPRTGPHPIAPVVPYLIPFVLAAAMWPLGWIAHTLLGGQGATTALYCALIGICGALSCLVLHLLAEARSWYADVVYTAGCALGTVWAIVATAWTPFMPAAGFYIVVAFFFGVIAAAHRALAGAEEEGGQAKKVKLPSWAQIQQWLDLTWVALTPKKTTDTQVKAEFELEPGRTVAELQSHADQIASAYGVAPGAVRISEDPGHARRGHMTVVTRDVMGQIVPWPGLDDKEKGASIEDAPLTLGLYEDGEKFTVNPVNNHTLTVGMSGAGKSVYGKVKLVSIAARSDTFTVAIDLAKGKQTLGPVEGAIGWAALNDKKAARMTLDGLKRAVKARADYLGERGLAQWERGCGLVFLHVLLEEAAELADFDELVELLRVARSVGMHFEISLQRATYGNLDTDARANLGDGVCFGVRDPDDATYVLPDYVTDSGADPARWRKSKPGACYAAVDSQDPDRHTIPIKMYGPPSADKADENKVLAAEASALPDQDAKLDDITREAFGPAYADYLAKRRAAAPAPAAEPTEAAPAAARPVLRAVPEPAEPAPSDHENRDDQETEKEEEELTMTDEDIFGEDADLLTADTPDVEAITEEDELEELENDFVLPRLTTASSSEATKHSKQGAEQARAVADQVIADWAKGGETFTAPEFRAAVTAAGVDRERTWYKRQLERLETEGAIAVDDDGQYRVRVLEGATA
ncbi:P-loop NTPase family protein [Nocardiopsis suaedae]|uniref:Uncharacterized protein n=1 Tax=Nocardiopsis suaedae TaxID=3018444 RepID=A0ABT4TIM9_9ACTN|nr:hypothetical protein [Nocardiopsis suaedae]MDA2804565.1 hypothetical protein [Nocardiopsis suaedae]